MTVTSAHWREPADLDPDAEETGEATGIAAVDAADAEAAWAADAPPVLAEVVKVGA